MACANNGHGELVAAKLTIGLWNGSKGPVPTFGVGRLLTYHNGSIKGSPGTATSLPALKSGSRMQ